MRFGQIRLRAFLATDSPARSRLWGGAGIGKRAFAEKLGSAAVLEVPASQMAPCGTCTSCRQVIVRTHPDLITIKKPADKSSIPLSAFEGDDLRRMREGLCHDIALKPLMGGRRVAIVDDADYLNEETRNCLLKTLEEPPSHSVLILIGTSPDKQLPPYARSSHSVSTARSFRGCRSARVRNGPDRAGAERLSSSPREPRASTRTGRRRFVGVSWPPAGLVGRRQPQQRGVVPGRRGVRRSGRKRSQRPSLAISPANGIRGRLPPPIAAALSGLPPQGDSNCWNV